MNKQIFINVPVRDLTKATGFYSALGAACLWLVRPTA